LAPPRAACLLRLAAIEPSDSPLLDPCGGMAVLAIEAALAIKASSTHAPRPRTTRDELGSSLDDSSSGRHSNKSNNNETMKESLDRRSVGATSVCSDASFEGCASHEAWRSMSLDLDPEACELARLHASAAGVGGAVEVMCGDALATKLPNGSIGVVVTELPFGR